MPKTSPERSRETRQRKTVPKLKRPAKTVAERSRDYRARRKAIENAAIHTLMRARSSASVLISDDKSIANQTPFHQNLEDTHVDMPENQYSLYMYLNPRNSLDEQQVDYNNRPIVVQVDVDQQDLPLLSGNSSASTGQIQSSGENVTTLRKTKKVAKTAAERCREYRARLKAAKDTTNIRRSMRNTSTNLQADDIVALQEVSQQISTSKTPAERSSEYRARKRACKNATEPQSTSESSSSIQYSDNNVISREPSPLNEQLATQQNPTINIINSRKSLIDSNSANDIQTADSCVPYSEYRHRNKAHHKFKTKCIDNSYRKICSVCDRLSFKAKLRYPGEQQKEILTKILPKKSMDEILVCNTCMSSLKKNKIPAMSTYNGFKNSQTPTSLPPLDLVSEKLISPRIPVVQIPKLGHVNDAPTQKRYLKRDAIPSCNLPLAESNSFPGATVTNEANENLMAIRTTDDGTPYTYVTVMSNDLEPEISPEKNAENYKHQNDRRYKDDRSVLDRLVIKEECQEPEIKQEPLDEEINQFYQYTDPKKSLTEERTASNSLTIKEEPQEMDIKFETVDLPDLDLHGHFDRLWEPSSVVHSKVARKSTIFHETATQTDEQLNGPKFIDIIKSNKDLNILTGIPNFSVLNTILDVAKVASPSLAKAKGLTLDIADRIIMTFMKLKQDLTYEALSVFFKCNSKKSCKRIILQMLDTLSCALKFAIRWPRKHEDSKNLPDLSYNLSNIRCIINRIDIALRRPKDPLRRITTFSCYKRYHSAKFMTVVTPAGFICFLSKAYGGRTSHRTLFEESNIIKNLEKNDEVMVFKDFSIDDICQNHNIRIVKSLYSQNVEDAQNEANYRIPLNINRRFRQFRIFRRKLTNTLSLKTEEILTILCAVENLNSFTSGITSSINS